MIMNVMEAAISAWDKISDKGAAVMIALKLALSMNRSFFTLSAEEPPYPFVQQQLWDNDDLPYQDYVRVLAGLLEYAATLSKTELENVTTGGIRISDLMEKDRYETMYGDQDDEFKEYAKDHYLRGLSYKTVPELKEEQQVKRKRDALYEYRIGESDWNEDVLGKRESKLPKRMKKYIKK